MGKPKGKVRPQEKEKKPMGKSPRPCQIFKSKSVGECQGLASSLDKEDGKEEGGRETYLLGQQKERTEGDRKEGKRKTLHKQVSKKQRRLYNWGREKKQRFLVWGVKNPCVCDVIDPGS